MGILKSISEMGIAKLVILGALWLVVGVPTLALLVTLVVSITSDGSVDGLTTAMILALALGIPGFALFVGMAVSIIVGPFALWHAPWKDRMPAPPTQASRARKLSFGIVLLTIGAGIISLAYVLSIIPGIGIDEPPMVLGGLLLFGGLGLIISYIVVSRIEKRQKAE